MKALLLCASHNDLGLVGALRKLGYEILVTGNVPGQPGEKYADQYIQMDYSDKEAILRLARKEKIDVICQCCNDFGVYTAAYVAEKLGLPGYDSYETTLMPVSYTHLIKINTVEDVAMFKALYQMRNQTDGPRKGGLV